MSLKRSFIPILVVLWCWSNPLAAQTHFQFTSNTGENATVGIPLSSNPKINGSALASGDEIGAFSPAGLCVGALVWNQVGGSITVWGDDSQTSAIDGMRAGEEIHYRVWRKATNTEYAVVSVTYSQGNGLYSANGIYLASSLTATAPPDPPTLVSPADGASGIATPTTFTWNASPYATSYRLQADLDSLFRAPAIDTTGLSQTSCAADGLASGTTYYWRVSAVNAAGSSDFSTRRSFTTIQAPLSAPSLVAPADGSTNQPTNLTCSWTSVSRADNYVLQVSENTSFSPLVLDDSTLTGTSHQVTGLGNGATYQWRVRAKNTFGASPWSTTWTFSTIPLPPTVPQPVSPDSGAADQPTSVTATWNPATRATSYKIQVSSSATFASPVVDDSTTATSFAFSNLSRSTTYYWRIRGSNAGGLSNWSTAWTFTTIPPAPADPVLSSPADGSTGQATTVTLNWGTVATAASYRLQVSNTASFTTTVVDDSSLTATFRSVGSLANNTTYYWRVRAKNAGGSSGWTSIWSFTTIIASPETPVLSSPANSATGQPTSVILAWNAAARAETYRVQLSTTPAFTSTIVDDSTLSGTSKQVSSLAKSATFYWRTNAKNAGGTSAWSAAWAFTTASGLPNPPASPVLLSPANGSTGLSQSVSLQWKVSSGATSYHLQVSTDSTFAVVFIDDTALTTTSRTADQLANGTQYFWHVLADNEGGSSPWSDRWAFTTAAAPTLTAPVLVSPFDGAKDQPLDAPLKWRSVSAATSYEVQVAYDSFFTNIVFSDTSVTDTACIPVGLRNGTNYCWRVRARGQFAVGPWASRSTFWTIPLAPAAPILALPASGDTTQSANPILQWYRSASATSYRVVVSAQLSFSTLVLDSTLADTAIVFRGSNDRTYFWHVSANNSGGGSPWSEARDFRTATSPPPAPTLVSPSNGAQGQSTALDLVWNAEQSATSYRVQLASSSGFSSVIVDSTGVQSSRCSISGLSGGTTYYWRVLGINSGGQGPWANAWNFTTAQGDPSAPAPQSPPNSSTGISINPTLAWSSVSGALSYRLQLSTNTDFSTITYDASGLTSTSQTLNGLAKGTTYYWRVNATFLLSTSAWSSVWGFTTVFDPPTAPAQIAPADGAQSLAPPVTFGWSGSTNAASYRLQLSGSASFSTTLLDTAGIVDTSFSLSGLSTGTTYYWRIAARNSGGVGPWSSVWQFATALATPSSPILALPSNGSIDRSTSLRLEWNPVSGAASYRVQLSPMPDLSASLVDTAGVNQLSLSIDSLAQHTTYYWKVSASNESGQGSPSPVWSFSTVDPAVTTTLVTTVDFPPASRTTTADYRLFGLPGDSRIGIASLLKGEVGTEWRVFWDNGKPTDYFVEFDGGQAFTCSLGRAFWVIHDESLPINASVSATPLNEAEQAEISLHPGWNLITDPFTEPVSWSSVLATNSISEPIYRFNGSFDTSAALTPFAGYYFFNATNLSVLKVPKGSTAPPVAASTASSGERWTVRMALTCADQKDAAAWFGVSSTASEGKDGFDVHKPHGILNAASICFERPSWDAAYPSFASDIRPSRTMGETWDIEITASPGRPCSLSFSDLGDVPSAFRLMLLDSLRGLSVDLRQRNHYEFTPVTNRSTLKVAAGDDAYIRQELNALPKPSSFSLGNNFPNPFNPSTSIPVSIPFRVDVRIEVFNLLGQRVRVLYTGSLEQGIHYFTWDGTDEAQRSVASGFYFVRLIVGGTPLSVRKVMLVR